MVPKAAVCSHVSWKNSYNCQSTFCAEGVRSRGAPTISYLFILLDTLQGRRMSMQPEAGSSSTP
eukprot:933507-Pelagomonas_calceolata.AAC.2